MARDDRRPRAEDRTATPDLHGRARPELRADRAALLTWRLTVRSGPRVDHDHFDNLDDALDALEREGHELERSAPREALDTKVRRFDPVQLIAARLEVAGPERVLPTVRGGVDIRGDGSTEAFVGWIRRRVLAARGDEGPYAALRRELAAKAPGSRR